MTPQEAQVRDALAGLGIAVERHEHPPVATAVEADEHWSGIDAAHCKNLFLRNQKGTRHYLVIVQHRKRVDLRAVSRAPPDAPRRHARIGVAIRIDQRRLT
jgi:Ala-tRNA(Pro) deacylase